MSKINQDTTNLIATVRRQQHWIRALVVANVLILGVMFLTAAKGPSKGKEPVDEIVFQAQDESQWRISAIENAIVFDVKQWQQGQNPRDHKWKSVARLATGGLSWIRFDVGNVGQNLSETEQNSAAMASMGIETDRNLSLPFLSAIQNAPPAVSQAESATSSPKFPYGENVNHATLGFGRQAPPPSGPGGANTGILSFSPSLTMSQVRPHNWNVFLFNPNPGKEPQLILQMGDKETKYGYDTSQ